MFKPKSFMTFVFIPKLLAALCAKQRFISQDFFDESSRILMGTSIMSGLPLGTFCGGGKI